VAVAVSLFTPIHASHHFLKLRDKTVIMHRFTSAERTFQTGFKLKLKNCPRNRQILVSVFVEEKSHDLLASKVPKIIPSLFLGITLEHHENKTVCYLLVVREKQQQI